MRLFSAAELREFLRFGPHGSDIYPRLPDGDTSLAELAFAVVELLERRGAVDEAFFRRLRKLRPRRRAEIDEVAGQFGALVSDVDHEPAPRESPDSAEQSPRPPVRTRRAVLTLAAAAGLIGAASTVRFACREAASGARPPAEPALTDPSSPKAPEPPQPSADELAPLQRSASEPARPEPARPEPSRPKPVEPVPTAQPSLTTESPELPSPEPPDATRPTKTRRTDAEIRRAIETHAASELKRCENAAGGAGDQTLVVTLQISPAGRATNVHAGGTILGDEFHACAATAVRAVTFSPLDGPLQRFVYRRGV